jgi:acyl-CoA hydrolase
VAYACAAKHAGNYCVTVTVDNVHFLQPVEVGELVSLMASVNYVGNTSLVIGIKVIAENVKTGTVKHTNTSYFTMVAKGEDDLPTQVPGLLLENQNDVRRFLDALRRREIKGRYQADLNRATGSQSLGQELHRLAGERCQVTTSVTAAIL